MKVYQTLEKKMEETENFEVANATYNQAQQLVLENQLQIMRGLHALLCGEFVAYDDSKEEG